MLPRKSQNLVQVSTYAPLVDKLRLEAIAEKQGKTLYVLVREILKDYLASKPVETPNEDKGENLL
jgi:predicted DNA-binding protein